MSAGIHTIGLGHTLPIYNPILLAERMAQSLQCNIYITTSKTYIGDYQLSESSSSTKITLPHTIHYGNGSGATSMLVILENGLRLLNKEISLKELASKIISGKTDDIGYDLPLYYWCNEHDTDSMEIYPNHITLFLCSSLFFRWWHILDAFESEQDESKKMLLMEREAIHRILKPLGCSHVLISSDEGCTEDLGHSDLYRNTEDLLKYIQEKQYLRDKNICYKSPENILHIKYTDYLDKKLELSDDEFVSIIIDQLED